MEQITRTAIRPEIITLFQAYIMQSLDPGEFYRLDNQRWIQLLDEIEESYEDADQFFPFSENDVNEIRESIDTLLEKEFGFDLMRQYALTH